MRSSVLAFLALTLPSAGCGSDFVDADTDGTSTSSTTSAPTSTAPPTTTAATGSTSTGAEPTSTGMEPSSTGAEDTSSGGPSSATGSSSGGEASSSSTGAPIECGDGVAEGDEACDGDDLNAQGCEDAGFFFGELACTDRCTLDTAACSNTAEFCVDPSAAITDAAPLASTLTIPTAAFIASIAAPVELTHGDVGELELVLSTPDALAAVTLANATCPGGADIDARFVDGAMVPDCADPIAVEGDVAPAESFDALVGSPAMGDWTLTVTDSTAGNDGVLERWCLEVELATDSASVCGDGSITFGEDCDGEDLTGLSCADFDGFVTGDLACDAVTCTFDTSACQAPGCGNGLLEPDTEDCDGDDLGGQTCQDQGFASGELACAPGCGFDTSACSSCGNNVTNGTDICDGTSVGGATCASEGFLGGTMACLDDCSGLDTSGCTNDIIAVCSEPGTSLTTAFPERTDTLTVDTEGTIADLDVFVRIDHSWVGDLDIELSTATQSATLLSNQCSDVDDILAVFDDDASTGPDCAAPVAVEGSATPVDALTVFSGEASADDFTLTVTDSFPMGEFGTFEEWCVYITLED